MSETEEKTQAAQASIPPTVGRIVHYVVSPGEHRAAIVVRHWSGDMANLYVFLDGMNDSYFNGVGTQIAPGLLWVTSVHQDEDEKKLFTWHWPERV